MGEREAFPGNCHTAALLRCLAFALNATGSSPLVIGGDFNLPHTGWGYKHCSAAGRNLWQDSHDLGFNLITDPTFPTRLGTSTTSIYENEGVRVGGLGRLPQTSRSRNDRNPDRRYRILQDRLTKLLFTETKAHGQDHVTNNLCQKYISSGPAKPHGPYAGRARKRARNGDFA
ncbi:hypothetical protein HPB49_024017 [Dermacentor silvarum]|uniref:Uncharacterized protein n=1 Tax=Dermacentor silvarum TaxID=543639 RepID=A0ACB8E488_DERSI|nr:hypothetical protein HPB49_024017 [Dermacentor silvarum]